MFVLFALFSVSGLFLMGGDQDIVILSLATCEQARLVVMCLTSLCVRFKKLLSHSYVCSYRPYVLTVCLSDRS